jgi:glycosyltransferase involved in cell wall biosynthesis
MTASARLALFLPTLDEGGAERVMLQLGVGFAARGHHVDLVVAIPGGPLEGQVPAGLNRIDLGARRTIQALPALGRYLRSSRPAAMLSTLEHSNVLAIGANLLSLSGVRVVLREANVLLPRAEMKGTRPHLLRALMRASYRQAAAVVAVSQSVADSVVSGLGLPAQQVRTIYNPIVTVDLPEKAAAPVDDPWFAPGAAPVVLGVGRLAPQKDLGTLLRAFALVRSRRPDRPVRLVILGEGPERAALEALARELGIDADVRLPGLEKNPFRFMQRAAVFALSSIYEGLPGALIQAMACGCRVVSTDCPGGSREILQDGALGPLVPTRAPEALADAIARLLDDAERNPGRASYPVERFTEAAAVDGYLAALGVSSR